MCALPQHDHAMCTNEGGHRRHIFLYSSIYYGNTNTFCINFIIIAPHFRFLESQCALMSYWYELWADHSRLKEDLEGSHWILQSRRLKGRSQWFVFTVSVENVCIQVPLREIASATAPVIVPTNKDIIDKGNAGGGQKQMGELANTTRVIQ